jgi:predicted nucleic acid-binding protein
MIVVDANILSAFALHGPDTDAARKARLREEWCAPLLWRAEFRSALLKHIRVKKITLEQATGYFKQIEILLRAREHPVLGVRALELAAKTQASAYDCEYVALAESFNQRLLTLDKPLTVHFPKTAIYLHDYIAK